MIRHEITGRATRRKLLGLGLSTLGLTLLAACAAPPAAAPTSAPAPAPTQAPPPTSAPTQPTAVPIQAAAPAAEKVTIEVWNSDWGQLYNDLMKKISDAFTKDHPNIVVNWQFVDKIEEKLLTSFAAGTPPDTHYTNYLFQGTVNFKNVLKPLTGYVKDAGYARDDFIKAVYDPCLYKGQLMALPGGADWIVHFYNKDMFKDAGLDAENPPRTFTTLAEASDKLLKKDGAGNFTQIGFWPSNFGELLFNNGGQLYDSENQKVTPTHPKVVEHLEWQVSLAKKLDMTKVDSFWNGQPGYSKPGSPFASGRAAFLRTGFWAYDPLDKYAPKINYGITNLPTPKGTDDDLKNQSTPWWAYAIPLKAQRPDQAWAFDRYAFIDKAAQMGYDTLNGPCTLKSLPDFEEGVKKAIGPNNRMAPYLPVFTKIAKFATSYFPSIPVSSMYSDELDRAFDQAIHGKMEPKAALEAVASKVQPELDKALKAAG